MDLDFKEHLKIIFKKVSKTIGLLCKLQNLLPRKSLITVYKSYKTLPGLFWYHLWPFSFPGKLGSIQYNNAALARTAAGRGTSKEKLYQELGLK